MATCKFFYLRAALTSDNYWHVTRHTYEKTDFQRGPLPETDPQDTSFKPLSFWGVTPAHLRHLLTALGWGLFGLWFEWRDRDGQVRWLMATG